MECRLPGCCNRAGGVDVDTEVAAMIDPGNNPVRILTELGERNAAAVGGCAVDRDALLGQTLDTDRPTRGDRVTGTRLDIERCDNVAVPEALHRVRKGGDSRGMNAVVVGQEDLHGCCSRESCDGWRESWNCTAIGRDCGGALRLPSRRAPPRRRYTGSETGSATQIGAAAETFSSSAPIAR